MALTIKDIVGMKEHTNNLGINSYDWFFAQLENNHLSKLDGVKRNIALLAKYNQEAQDYIIEQLSYVSSDAASDLQKELNKFELVLSKEDQIHIVRY